MKIFIYWTNWKKKDFFAKLCCRIGTPSEDRTSYTSNKQLCVSSKDPFYNDVWLEMKLKVWSIYLCQNRLEDFFHRMMNANHTKSISITFIFCLENSPSPRFDPLSRHGNRVKSFAMTRKQTLRHLEHNIDQPPNHIWVTGSMLSNIDFFFSNCFLFVLVDWYKPFV